jgi:hypothetical protein
LRSPAGFKQLDTGPYREVRDVVLWAKHIYGDVALKERLLGLAAGEIAPLVVDGFAGAFVKMQDGKDGRPTQGFKPIGEARARWRQLYRERRKGAVEILIAEGAL